jgi:DNA-binding MarR family transcriptional regulator
MNVSIGRSLASELLDELLPLVAQQRHAWATRCHAQGLSMGHFQVLSALELEGPVPMSRLADLLGVALSNATGIVGRMEERGLVERTHDETDRRVVLARLTDAGRRMVGEMESSRLAKVSRVVDTMSPDEQADLLRGVRALRTAMQRSRATDLTELTEQSPA